jgi:(p)ppGpp synthase/HD superfamily hydrolase
MEVTFDFMLTHRYDDALVLAHSWHRTQGRKGTGTPYVAHLLSVSALVLEHGGTEDEAVAGLLHDALEDAKDQQEADARRDKIRHRFGQGVLDVVEACTDAEPRAKQAEAKLQGDGRRKQWKVRKTGYIDHLARATASVLLVSAADKVHNASAIVRDLTADGPEVFSRFVGRREGTLWYYGTVLRALESRAGDEPRIEGLVRELGRLVSEMG